MTIELTREQEQRIKDIMQDMKKPVNNFIDIAIQVIEEDYQDYKESQEYLKNRTAGEATYTTEEIKEELNIN